METRPYLVQETGAGEALQPIGERERAYSEGWLQELLRRRPDILPVAEIEPVFSPPITIGREVPMGAGFVDDLFISPRGYPVLVETKLWRNPQARREVIAQAIDYGSALSRWTYGQLDDAVRRYLRSYEQADMGLAEWVEQRHGPLDGGRHFFEETVARNLRLGRFLTMIVGDRIRQSLVEMLDYANKYPHLATDVALVELHCYRYERGSDWPLLVVPFLVARTEIVERSIVQITLKPEMAHEVEVIQEKAEPKAPARRAVSLSEEAYWEFLGQQAPEASRRIRQLVDEFLSVDGTSIEPGEQGLAVRFAVPPSGLTAPLFFVNTSGGLCVWLSTLEQRLHQAGVDDQLSGRFASEMRTLLNMPPARKHYCRSVLELDLASFAEAGHTLLKELQKAAG